VNMHVFLLVCLLIVSLALLCVLCWPHHGPLPSKTACTGYVRRVTHDEIADVVG